MKFFMYGLYRQVIFFGKKVGEKVGEEIARLAVEWAKNRLKKKGSKFPMSVPIYAPGRLTTSERLS